LVIAVTDGRIFSRDVDVGEHSEHHKNIPLEVGELAFDRLCGICGE
jgi:hypothetical protein